MITNWIVTVHWPNVKEKRVYTAFEEAFEYACYIKARYEKPIVTIKRERREFAYWLNLIVNAPQAT